MSNPNSEDPTLQDDECGDGQTDDECGDAQTDDECGDAQTKLINGVKKRKLDLRDVCNLINISQLPKEEHEFKVMIESERLSKRVEKKMEAISKKYNALEKLIDQFKDLVEKKSSKSDQVIEAYKKKAINIKSAIAEESRKYVMVEARTKAAEDEFKELEKNLAMCHEQYDEIQEKGKNERNRLTHEINNIKEKIVREEDRNQKKIQNLLDEKRYLENKHCKMQEKMARDQNYLEEKTKNLRTKLNTERMESQNKIQDLKQQRIDLLAKIEDEKKENKINENKLNDSITSLQDIIQINKDQNEKMKYIELMVIKFATTKEQYEKNMQSIQQIETKILSGIEVEKAKMRQDIESLQKKSAEKHDKCIAAMEQIKASLY